jgi:hypothetical protein
MVANPGHSLVRRKAVKDGQRGQGGSCAAHATATDNLNPFAVVSTAQSLVKSVEGLDAITRNPEIAPTNAAETPAGQAGVAQN